MWLGLPECLKEQHSGQNVSIQRTFLQATDRTREMINYFFLCRLQVIKVGRILYVQERKLEIESKQVNAHTTRHRHRKALHAQVRGTAV